MELTHILPILYFNFSVLTLRLPLGTIQSRVDKIILDRTNKYWTTDQITGKVTQKCKK